MATAKPSQPDGSQAVRLLRSKLKPGLETLADVARFMQENFPEGRDFPDCDQAVSPQIRDLELD
jgi:hypothetical protein